MTSFDCALIPPSPITTQTPLEIRVACRDSSFAKFAISITNGTRNQILFDGHGEKILDWSNVAFRINTADWCGDNTIIIQTIAIDNEIIHEQRRQIQIVESFSRSTGKLDGAWCGLYHWSESEGKLWNPVIKQFTTADWQQLIRDMHSLDMNVIVLQELFRNEQYFGKHDIPNNGYRGNAFYPSALYPGRMDIACSDPVEAIMTVADELGMHVFPGIGMYAWFDFTPGSLEWHKQVAAEIWHKYGHHSSFYGWYISEEVFGDLHYGDNTERNIVEFFRAFKQFKNQFSPVKPVMLAPNCFYVRRGETSWRNLAKELDIICPFAFHRMDAEDDSPEDTIALLQDICNQTGAHLWLDMESFLFNSDMSLYPRPVTDMILELQRFNAFEKILCYQFPGLMNSPTARLQPGGPATVDNFVNYQEYVKKITEGV